MKRMATLLAFWFSLVLSGTASLTSFITVMLATDTPSLFWKASLPTFLFAVIFYLITARIDVVLYPDTTN